MSKKPVLYCYVKKTNAKYIRQLALDSNRSLSDVIDFAIDHIRECNFSVPEKRTKSMVKKMQVNQRKISKIKGM